MSAWRFLAGALAVTALAACDEGPDPMLAVLVGITPQDMTTHATDAWSARIANVPADSLTVELVTWPDLEAVAAAQDAHDDDDGWHVVDLHPDAPLANGWYGIRATSEEPALGYGRLASLDSEGHVWLARFGVGQRPQIESISVELTVVSLHFTEPAETIGEGSVTVERAGAPCVVASFTEGVDTAVFQCPAAGAASMRIVVTDGLIGLDGRAFAPLTVEQELGPSTLATVAPILPE